MMTKAGMLFQQTEKFCLSFETNRKGLLFIAVNKLIVFFCNNFVFKKHQFYSYIYIFIKVNFDFVKKISLIYSSVLILVYTILRCATLIVCVYRVSIFRHTQPVQYSGALYCISSDRFRPHYLSIFRLS
jgi:hypothetical protein